jgi:hypothetical protein
MRRPQAQDFFWRRYCREGTSRRPTHLRNRRSQQATAPHHTKQPPPSRPTAAMLLLDYQNVLIESLLKDRVNGCE